VIVQRVVTLLADVVRVVQTPPYKTPPNLIQASTLGVHLRSMHTQVGTGHHESEFSSFSQLSARTR
jgi:hypothetical protein